MLLVGRRICCWTMLGFALALVVFLLLNHESEIREGWPYHPSIIVDGIIASFWGLLISVAMTAYLYTRRGVLPALAIISCLLCLASLWMLEATMVFVPFGDGDWER